MKELDDFSKRLEELRSQQPESHPASQGLIPGYQSQKMVEYFRAKENYVQKGRQLQELVHKEFLPIFDKLNQQYLLGSGRIVMRLYEKELPLVPTLPESLAIELREDSGPDLELGIIWDYQGNGDSGSEKKITLILNQSTAPVRLFAGATIYDVTREPTTPVFSAQLEDKELKGKIMAEILSLLENPSSCKWSWDHSRPELE